MTTKILEKMVKNLSEEVAQLRVLVLNHSNNLDHEGEYKPEFVKKINKLAKVKSNGIKYTTREDLAKRIGL